MQAKVIKPNQNIPVSMKLSFKEHLKDLLPSFVRAIKRRVKLSSQPWSEKSGIIALESFSILFATFPSMRRSN
jgi:hypothetical protein